MEPPRHGFYWTYLLFFLLMQSCSLKDKSEQYFGFVGLYKPSTRWAKGKNRLYGWWMAAVKKPTNQPNMNPQQYNQKGGKLILKSLGVITVSDRGEG